MRQQSADEDIGRDWENLGYEKGRKTRRRIIDVASRLFSSQGYDATSIGQISSSAGLTKGAVYGHFGRKREIYVACLKRSLNFFRESVPIDPKLSSEKALAAYLSWFGSKLQHKAIVRSLLIQIIREKDDSLKTTLILDLLTPPFAQLRELVRQLNPKIDSAAHAFFVFSALVLDADLHRYYVLMSGNSADRHNIRVTISRLVSMIKHAH